MRRRLKKQMATDITTLEDLSCAICTDDIILTKMLAPKLKAKDLNKRHDNNVLTRHSCCGAFSHQYCALNHVRMRASNTLCTNCFHPYSEAYKIMALKSGKIAKRIRNDNVVRVLTTHSDIPEELYFRPGCEIVINEFVYGKRFEGIVEESVVGKSRIYYNKKDNQTWEDNTYLHPIYKYFGHN